MSFKVGKAKDYKLPVIHYKPPVQIGHFSTDSENQFCDDDRQMKYLSIPEELENLSIDLNEGYAEYVGVSNDDENSYDKFLRWIIFHKEEVGSLFTQEDSTKREIYFICQRSLLTTINSTLYEKFDDWSIYATKFHSVIYLSQTDTEENIHLETSCTEDEKRRTSWRYKFEQCVTSESTPSHPVNVNEKYFAVMKGKLKNHNILFTGETGVVDPLYKVDPVNESKSMNRFVEIKTNYVVNTMQKTRNFRRKILKWYLQSFIAGVPRLICGFRDVNGILEEVKEYNVSDLPRKGKGLWSPDACFNFGSSFLNHVKQCVVKDDPKVVYKFYWKQGSSAVTCEELGPRHQFLPEWYIKEMSEN